MKTNSGGYHPFADSLNYLMAEFKPLFFKRFLGTYIEITRNPLQDQLGEVIEFIRNC
jgi:hypothetical protein